MYSYLYFRQLYRLYIYKEGDRIANHTNAGTVLKVSEAAGLAYDLPDNAPRRNLPRSGLRLRIRNARTPYPAPRRRARGRTAPPYHIAGYRRPICEKRRHVQRGAGISQIAMMGQFAADIVTGPWLL